MRFRATNRTTRRPPPNSALLACTQTHVFALLYASYTRAREGEPTVVSNPLPRSRRKLLTVLSKGGRSAAQGNDWGPPNRDVHGRSPRMSASRRYRPSVALKNALIV